MSIAVKNKPSLRWPFVTDGPQKFGLVPLVEYIHCINKEKSALLVFLIILSCLPGHEYPAFYPHLQSSTKLLGATDFFCHPSRNNEHAFAKWRRHISPTQTGQTPGHLSSAIMSLTIMA